MARATKQGLDYFPHSCNYDDELKYIISLYGSNGYMTYFELLKRIYSGHGYYMSAEKKSIVLFSSEINVDINLINDIINECLSQHLFDKCLHKKHNILTSSGIQQRYFEAIKRRKQAAIINEYILIDNVDILLNNVNINYQNVNKSTQSKVKYSKVEYLLSEIKISDLKDSDKPYYEIAISFFDLFKKNLTDAGASITNLYKAKGTWINDARLLIEKDKYSIEVLRAVFKFLQHDEFWKSNILSISTLRKQMDKLILKINYNGKIKRNNSQGITNEQLAGLIAGKFASDR